MIVGTPIGNLGDLSPRAERALCEADVVLAEDTRVTAKLLSHIGAHTPLERCDENVIARRASEIADRIVAGETVAFCSDAGMPCVSDPGTVLVAEVRDRGLEVEVIPGPCAAVTALAASGLVSGNFYFGGFLPRKDTARVALLKSLANLPAALVFYESPHRVRASLEAFEQVFPERMVVIARELTKLHEEVLSDKPAGLIDVVDSRGGELKGEVVFVVEAPGKDASTSALDEDAALAVICDILARNASRSEKARDIAECMGVPKGVVYDAMRGNGAPDMAPEVVARAIMTAVRAHNDRAGGNLDTIDTMNVSDDGEI